MFEKLKAFFRRKKAEQSKLPPLPQAPTVTSATFRPFSVPRPASAAPSRRTEDSSSDGDLATGYVVGMATNNALMGYAACDITRDGSPFDAGRSDCGSSSSDSGSSSSCSCD